MLCQHCHKNEATIHVQQIVDGHVQAYHLCEECASKNAAGDSGDFNLAEVLFDIADKVAGAAAEQQEKEDSSGDAVSVCPECGWSLQRFRKTGYLGCPECYKAFAPLIAPLLKSMHRGVKHVGKIPQSAGTGLRKGHERILLNRELERIRNELEEKIRKEEYEEAAVLRDRIRELDRKIRESGEAI